VTPLDVGGLRPYAAQRRRVPRPADWGIGMSVCIAASCDFGAKIVVAIDTMASLFGGTFTGDDAMTKGAPLWPGRWGGLLAGDDVTRAGAVLDRAEQALHEQHDQGVRPTRDLVASIVLSQYQNERTALATETYLSIYGLDMAAFLSNGSTIFGDASFGVTCDRIEQVDLGCELLLYGFDEDNRARLFTIGHPGTIKYFDTTGYWAIGSGAYSALSRLLIRQQRESLSLAETIYNVYEAKVAAEGSVGVGRRIHIHISSPDRAFQSINCGRLLRETAEGCLRAEVPASVFETISKSIIDIPIFKPAAEK
jgi:hypothetical protein